MYILAEMKDVVHVKPWYFDQDLLNVIEDELNKKFANKIIYQLGLCVALFDIKDIGDSSVLPGVYVSLSFFDDIFIPASNLQKPSRFDEKEQLFIWQYDTGESVHDLYIDIGEEIRFRVVNEIFVDTTPTGPPKKNDSNILGTSSVAQSKEETKCPYTIIGSINEPAMITLLRCKVINHRNVTKVLTCSKYNFTTSNCVRNESEGESVIKKSDYYDIVVCGGGMVGAAMTLALGQDNIFKNLKIAMIDTAPEKKDYDSPEIHNYRVCALSPSTIELLKRVGSWDFITQHRHGDVHNMHVWDGSSDAFISFKNEEGSNLAWIVENDLILASLNRNLSNFDNVKVFYSNKIQSFDQNEQSVDLKLKDDCSIRTKLLIGSDGGESFIRKQANLDVTKWDYDQTAIVSTLKLANKGPNFTAWQRFLSTGPIALLPLNDEYSSLVWSIKKNLAKELLSISDSEFVHRVNEAFVKEDFKSDLGTGIENLVQNGLDLMRNVLPNGNNLISDHETTVRLLPPKIESCGPRGSFPLSFLHSSNYVTKRLALIGDSVHKIHPLAGQGVNLGFGDVISLHECLRENVLSGTEIGSWHFLKQYEARRQREVFPKMVGIDALNKLYTDYDYGGAFIKTPLVALRTIGLTISNRVLPLKNIFAQQAMK
ncbi:unnamed protein product [Brachionus calyciflorus]|uniref:Ubiquinone biosynthesis monooxygenase COQ6, mitochondrial n=1 Tax=Brachionus calyciflorus TaxID=104777 RepID=A0A813NMN6_9BILA|nr:unnamed protein product [Brachionus calyciflorus]